MAELAVSLIVVLGHSKCGAVKSEEFSQPHPQPPDDATKADHTDYKQQITPAVILRFPFSPLRGDSRRYFRNHLLLEDNEDLMAPRL